VRLQLHALAYNLANFMRTLALPEEVEHWSLPTLREKLVKIGARIVRHGRYVAVPAGRGRGAAVAVREHPAADPTTCGQSRRHSWRAMNADSPGGGVRRP
jgi:DDE family transposase